MSRLGHLLKFTLGAALLAAPLVLAGTQANAQAKLRVAIGDVLSTETLSMIIAFERAKEKGVDYQVTHFAKEDLAIQAVINGQADLGIGTPYAVIQKSKAPLRVVFQATRLVFFPVAVKSYATWKDLNGQPFTFHARGSGTEAIGNIIAKREGIQFGDRSYVPGSENRIIAMMNGQIKATIVDLANKNLLMSKASDRFHVLPSIEEAASDELVFASEGWLKDNREQANIIVEELHKLWREMKADPGVIEVERAKRNLLSDQPKEVLDEVVPFYAEAVKEGVFAPLEDPAAVAKVDFSFYTEAGQLEGPADSLKVEDFWDLGPLDAAKKALGG